MVRYGSFCNSSTFILGLHNLSKPLLGRELNFKKVLKTVFHHTLQSTHTGFGPNKSPRILCQNRHQDLIVKLRLVDDDKERLAYTQVSVMEEPLLYIFLCISRISSSRRSLGSYAVEEIPLYFYVPVFPWKDFSDGMDQENSKTQGGKGQIRKIRKNMKERMEEKKEEIFTTWRFLYLCVLHRSGMPSGYLPPHVTLAQETPLIWEPPLQHNFP